MQRMPIRPLCSIHQFSGVVSQAPDQRDPKWSEMVCESLKQPHVQLARCDVLPENLFKLLLVDDQWPM